MKKNGKREWLVGSMLILAFAVWTVLVQSVDVQPVGPQGTEVGFASVNRWFHKLTGAHMSLYTITDWMGLIPVFVCMIFGGIGFVQLVKRRSLFRVDYDILCLGIYYVIVIFGYLVFEIIPVNYRPILIEGFLEGSYPSSTTLLVLSVIPTLSFQIKRRVKMAALKNSICILGSLFSTFMVTGRLISGVHWLTDIIGSVMLSAGLFCIYKAVVLRFNKEEN